MIYIKNARVFDGERYLECDCVEISGGKFVRFSKNFDINECDDKNSIDAQGYTLIPGFIDTHVHGICGNDCMQLGAVERMAKDLPRFGTTSFYPTSVSETDELTLRFLGEVQSAMSLNSGAQVMGAHLEGPCLAAEARGAHVERMLQNPTTDYFDAMCNAYGATVARVSIAPELPEALESIEKLTSSDIVVSIGHTHASGEIIESAAKHGATLVTHMYNAMTPMHHRQPGVVGAALTCDDLCCEFIADMVHVHPTCIDVLLRCKGFERAMFITDGMAAAGMPDGVYMLGTQEVEVIGGKATWEGKLAGSTLTMDVALKNLVNIAGVPFEKAVKLGTINPAKIMRIDDRKGRIALGYDADCVLLDKDLNIYMTFVRGALEYCAGALPQTPRAFSPFVY